MQFTPNDVEWSLSFSLSEASRLNYS